MKKIIKSNQDRNLILTTKFQKEIESTVLFTHTTESNPHNHNEAVQCSGEKSAPCDAAFCQNSLITCFSLLIFLPRCDCMQGCSSSPQQCYHRLFFASIRQIHKPWQNCLIDLSLNFFSIIQCRHVSFPVPNGKGKFDRVKIVDILYRYNKKNSRLSTNLWLYLGNDRTTHETYIRVGYLLFLLSYSGFVF